MNTAKKAQHTALEAELLDYLIEAKNALRYLIQETEARKGCPKSILGCARHHAERIEQAIAKAKGE